MTYWFVQSEDHPQSLKFTYNNTQHQKTGQKLHKLLSQLTYWLQRYEQGHPFPQVAADSKLGDSCQFVTRCDRDNNSDLFQDSAATSTDILNIATIQEVAI